MPNSEFGSTSMPNPLSGASTNDHLTAQATFYGKESLIKYQNAEIPF